MIPKVEGAEDIHYVDRLLAQLEAKAGLTRPILVHAILETARGVANVEEICARQPPHAGPVARPGRPRRQPPDEDHPRRRRPPRLPRARRTRPRRHRRAGRADLPAGPLALHRRPHGRRLRGQRHPRRSTGRSATSRTSSPARTSSATPSCSAASAPGACTPCRSTSPAGSSRPTPADVALAREVIAAMGDGTGAVMLDGKMEDDASVKQCQVMVDLADAARRPRPRAGQGLRLRRSRAWQELTWPTHAAPPPVGALHARRQRAGPREGQGRSPPTR